MKELIAIEKIKTNNENPRLIKEHKFLELVKSLKDFPEMLEKRPLIVDEDYVVLGGNMRLKALYQAGIKDVWVDVAKGWTDKQKKEFIIKDNVNFGQWDWDILANEWDIDDISDWGLEKPMFDDNNYEPITNPSIDKSDITQEEIEKRALELANQMKETFKEDSDVVCPNCGHEFKVKL